MGSWLFWGIVFLGGLLVGLGVNQLIRRKNSALPSSKLSHRINAITDSMQVKRVRKSPSVTQNATLRQFRNREPVDKAGLDTRTPSQKSTANRSAVPRPSTQPVVMRSKFPQKVNPVAQRDKTPPPQPKQPDVAQPRPSSPEDIDPAFEQTQIRHVRRPKSFNNQSSSVPTPLPDSIDEQTAMRKPSRIVKPSNSTYPKDFPN